MGVRTAHYIRFSGRRQIGKISLPSQLDSLRRESAAAGEDVVEVFIDQARSGATASNRPAYQALLAQARRGAFERIRVESVSRGHRNDFDRRAFETEMARYGVQVIYSGEAEKEGPQYRKLRRGLSGVVSEFQSDDASQLTYRRHKHRASQGRWRGGPWPYGLKPDGHGWFQPDPNSYEYLLWIMERRAEALGYHVILKMLNAGISLDGEARAIPPTPGLLAYQRKPAIEHQDPETGDVVLLPKRIPTLRWTVSTLQHICRSALDGVYAGQLVWGKHYARFAEDSEGNPKTEVRVDTGRPLLPIDLLRRVQAVELAALDGQPMRMSAYNQFLLTLTCGVCRERHEAQGEEPPRRFPVHGYTSTKYKAGKAYKYRKYRCHGRVNAAGSCDLPMLSADLIEHAVLDAVFTTITVGAQGPLFAELERAIDRRRADILAALAVLAEQHVQARERRESALDVLASSTALSPTLRHAFVSRAEEAVQAVELIEQQQRTLQLGVEVLDAQARSLTLLLNDPRLRREHWQDREAFVVLKRALRLLIHTAELARDPAGRYGVRMWLYTIDGLVVRENLAERTLAIPDASRNVRSGYTIRTAASTTTPGTSSRPGTVRPDSSMAPHLP